MQIGNIVGCILFIILGAIGTFFPELLYSLFESWKHQDDSGEPSQQYVWRTRAGGILIMVIGAIVLLAEIF